MGGYLFYLNVVQRYCFLFPYTHFSAEILHRNATFNRLFSIFNYCLWQQVAPGCAINIVWRCKDMDFVSHPQGFMEKTTHQKHIKSSKKGIKYGL